MRHRRRYRTQPVSASQMVRRYRRAAPGGDGGRADGPLARVAEAWSGVVGPAVSDKARPVRRSQAGLVTVACADAVWAQTLSSQADDLLDRLRAAVGDDAVSGLRFVPDEHALRMIADAAPSPEPPSHPPLTAEELAAAERLVAGVADPVLRDLLARAAARAPARPRRPKSP